MSRGSKATRKTNRYLKAYGKSVDENIKKKISKMPYTNQHTELYVLNNMMEELQYGGRD